MTGPETDGFDSDVGPRLHCTPVARPRDRLWRHQWDHRVADLGYQRLPGQDVALLP